MKTPNKSLGITIIELMIVLSILCLITSFGIPSLSSAIERAESRATQQALRTMLALARTEAISSESTLSLCGTDSTNTCIKHNFNQITVFIDKNRNAVVDESERVLFVRDIEYNGRISLNASFGKEYVRFKKDGSAEQAGSFVYCNPSHPELSLRLTVSMPGRIYIARDRDADGIVENTDGSPISC